MPLDPLALRRVLGGLLVLGLVGLVRTTMELFLGDGLFSSDFAVFFGGGELVLHGQPLYDRGAQEAVMRAVLDDGARVGGHLAFLLPPHTALLLSPFALLPLPVAFALFTVVSVALSVRLVFVLADLARADVRAVAVVVFALGPFWSSIVLGQLAIATALALAELARALRDGRETHAALALALLTFKPPFVPVLVAYLVGTGQWRVLGRAALMALALVTPSLVLLGPSAWQEWATGLRELEGYFAMATPPAMINARAVLARLLGDPERRGLATSIAWALLVMASLAAATLGRRSMSASQPTSAGSSRGRAALALAISLSLLFSPHLFFHDVLSWAVPVALARGEATRVGARERWDRFALAAPGVLLVLGAIDAATGGWLPAPPALAVPVVALTWQLRDARRPA